MPVAASSAIPARASPQQPQVAQHHRTGAAEHRRARRTLRLARPFRVLHHCSSRARLIGATLHPDGRNLTFHFIGADPSFEEYPRAEVVESAQALTVVPIARDIGPPGFRHLVGHPA